MAGSPEAVSPPEGKLDAAQLGMLGERVGELISLLEDNPDPGVRDQVAELLHGSDRLHRDALTRLAGLLAHHEMLEHACDDPIVAAVLDLYDLSPLDPAEAVARALEAVRPYIQSHGGDVDVLAVQDGVVRLRLRGACHGCSGSTVTLKRGVEAALRDGFPGFVAMEVDDSAPAAPPPRPAGVAMSAPGSTFIPLTKLSDLRPSVPEAPVWTEIGVADEVGEKSLAAPGDAQVLLCKFDGEIYAYRNGCGESPMPLHTGRLDGDGIVCSWHRGCSYGAVDGVGRGSAEGQQLVVYPVAVTAGAVRVALNKPRTAPLLEPATP
ncbi:MAG: NifU family protein [Candidatus Dormibacteria bacterium]